MNNLIIKGSSATFFTPTVDFNATSGVCIISGESYLENTISFYKQILSWLEEYLTTKDYIHFHFNLSYYNTTSSKSILQILLLLKNHEDLGAKVEITWHYNPEDEEMREEAEDYILETGMVFNIVADLVSN